MIAFMWTCAAVLTFRIVLRVVRLGRQYYPSVVTYSPAEIAAFVLIDAAVLAWVLWALFS